MNNIKKILEEQEKEFEKKFGNFTLPKRFKYNVGLVRDSFCEEDIKEHIHQSQKTLAQAIIKEMVGEKQKPWANNPLPAINKNRYRAEAKAKGEEILKEL